MKAMSWLAAFTLLAGALDGQEAGVTYRPEPGPNASKHVVLIAGDEEYRSEEALPLLGQVLTRHHGFRCTVLFSTDPETGEIDPENQTHIPGLAAIDDADLVVLFLRFRELPDADMRHLVDYVEAGKPLIGIRTSTHAFMYTRDLESPYADWDWRGESLGGFGRRVLGETWVAHHGEHGSESTRGVVAAGRAGHPLLRGVDSVWGPTDVYAVRDLPPDAVVVLEGEVVAGMKPEDPALAGEKNAPRMPIVWTRELVRDGAESQRIVCSTIGASVDFQSEGLRRLFVNACYWALRMEDELPERAVVDFVTPYAPTMFGFGTHVPGVKPSAHELE